MAVRNGMWDTVLMCLRDWPLILIPPIWQITSDLLQSQNRHYTICLWTYMTWILLTKPLPNSCPCGAQLPRHTHFRVSICSMPRLWSGHLDHLTLTLAISGSGFGVWWRQTCTWRSSMTSILREGKKDHCCHPKNSSTCVCVCVCVCSCLSHVHMVPNMPWRERQTRWNCYVFSRGYMQKICTKYIRSSLSYEWQLIQVPFCIWTKKVQCNTVD